MRLIDADALLKKLSWLDDYDFIIFKSVKGDIDSAPIIDVVPVVRCKDCKYCSVDMYADGNVPDYVCIEMDCGVEADGFCYWGERKENADNYH